MTPPPDSVPTGPALPAGDTPADALAALRAEIDALDDALHGLLLRRAGVVARMAGGRAKAGAPPLRPGREAAVLRRLLARNAAPLPPAALVRLWREIFAFSTGLQGGCPVALYARRPEHERLARDHFGALTPLRAHPTPARALAAVAAGEAAVAVLPLPEEAEPAEAAWWTGLDSPRLQVVARLPFWSAAAEPGPEALVVAAGAPDPTDRDRSLLRIEADAERGRAVVHAALGAAGLPPRTLLLRRDGPVLRALVELDGVVAAGDPRLAALPVARALPLGGYAVPVRGTES